jgi:hypothetical protein
MQLNLFFLNEVAPQGNLNIFSMGKLLPQRTLSKLSFCLFLLEEKPFLFKAFNLKKLHIGFFFPSILFMEEKIN